MHGGPRVPIVFRAPHLDQRIDRGGAAECTPAQVGVPKPTGVCGSEHRAIDQVGARRGFGEMGQRIRCRRLTRLEEMHLVTGIEQTRSGHTAPGARADNDDAATQEDFPASPFADSAYLRAASA